MFRKLGAKLLLVVLAATCGRLYQSGCYESMLVGLNPCGTVLAICTPEDWYRAISPALTFPNYELDPSCTIPYSCGTAYPPPVTPP